MAVLRLPLSLYIHANGIQLPSLGVSRELQTPADHKRVRTLTATLANWQEIENKDHWRLCIQSEP
jgi:hypothetical protein